MSSNRQIVRESKIPVYILSKIGITITSIGLKGRAVVTVMDSALWIAQILLAAGFLFSGTIKLFYDKYSAFVTSQRTSPAPRDLAPFIGIAEIAGAVGLILPRALTIAPALTVWAALGLAVIMLLAIGFHLRSREPILWQFVLFLLSAFVVWGRFPTS